MPAREWFWLYIAAVSLLGMILVASDKHRAVRHRWRIPEATLLLAAFAGGACAMFLTMLAIRHKTRHPKFMLGLPAFILLHVGALLFLQFKLHLPVFFFLLGW